MEGMIRSSVRPGSDRPATPTGASRYIRYGDRIFVRVINLQQGWRTVAEFEIRNCADMSEVYGELRHRTRGERGLMKLYVRNATRGWSFEQPFKLYGDKKPSAPGISVTHRPMQPGRREYAQGTLFGAETTRLIPDSIKTYEL
jgi:hypothetical protein